MFKTFYSPSVDVAFVEDHQGDAYSYHSFRGKEDGELPTTDMMYRLVCRHYRKARSYQTKHLWPGGMKDVNKRYDDLIEVPFHEPSTDSSNSYS